MFMPLQQKMVPKHASTLQRKPMAGPNGTASFEDRRPEAVAQRKIADIVSPAPQVLQQSSESDTVQAMTDSSSFFGEQPVQAMTEGPKKGSLDYVVQRASDIMGHDFSNVNVIQNSMSARSIGAHAYAQGNDIHVAQTLNMNRSFDQHLMGHELAHVVQQSKGIVQATGSVGGLPLNDNPQLESSADSWGQKLRHAL
ncbi:hypothetical protein FUAX_12010 [Fulvitalea axinellae]|uniref:eCIS core domain-containing protein n=1 Tax=Fulvitalea axinellae TaxID=1182444 RepID=A0AAU9CQS6_9BACT|nr:hypothetical protein FUAX_12010 [Fulvitalea axinellae]